MNYSNAHQSSQPKFSEAQRALPPSRRMLLSEEVDLRSRLWSGPEDLAYEWNLLISFVLQTAARPSEMADATWDQFDAGNTLWKVASKRCASQVRLVPLSRDARKTLACLWALRKLGDDRVFHFVKDAAGASRTFSAMARRAGAPGLRLHDLRRMGIMRFMSGKSASTTVAMQIAGLSSWTTLERYRATR